MSHQPYRTQSDTLKLQRLIEVLKERGSDLGSSLESSASDFLTDVKPKSSGVTTTIPHYTGEEEDDGSSYEGDINSERTRDFEGEADQPPKPLPCTPACAVIDKLVLEPPAILPLRRPSRPLLPPPPVPDESPPVDTAMRRRSGAAARLAAGGASQLVESVKHVHFQMSEDEDEEMSSMRDPTPTPPPPEEPGIAELVRKSSAVLQMLTMSIQDNKEEEAAGAKAQEAAPTPVSVVLEKSDSLEHETACEVNQPPVIDDDEPISLIDKDDPPDPKELLRLPKHRKKKTTLAGQWRKQRAKERSLSRETSPLPPHQETSNEVMSDSSDMATA